MSNTRSQQNELEQSIDEIKHYIKLRRQIRKYRLKYNILDPNIPELDMVAPANRPLRDYAASSHEEPHGSIASPAIDRNDFELKPSLLQAVQQNQFSGNPTDDPNLYLPVFVQYADTVKVNGVNPEAI